MRVDILSAVPQLMEGFFTHSILGRAQKKGLLSIHLHDLHDYSPYPHKRIDDYPYGGQAGMVLMIAPIVRAIQTLQSQRTYDEVIYFSPEAEVFTQKMANTLCMGHNFLLLCGHYKGVDQRIRDRYITREISIGEFVMSGGEMAAAVFVDCIARLIPGVIGDANSALTDSFQDGQIAPPVYTRPAEFAGQKVPEVLLSGNHQCIDDWQQEHAARATERFIQKNKSAHHIS